MDVSILVIIVQLIFLEGILSIDNAAVLGAMAASLPDTIAVPWPKSMRKVGDALHPVLGNQRTAALRVGLLGAYVGRGLMLVLASLVVKNPWLKLIGALYLLHLAFSSLGVSKGGHEHDESHKKSKAKGFWSVVVTIELADLIFSLDNVIAAVSLSDKLWVVLVGVAIGILAMRFAAGLFSYAVEREPILKSAAYILVMNIGIFLLLDEFFHIEINDWVRFGFSVFVILISLAYAHSPLLQKLHPVLHWIGQGFTSIIDLVDWALVPVTSILGLLWHGIRLIFTPKQQTLKEEN
ncbi:MAG TPA: hypothetical protein VHO48_06380 [Anaerolineaceae bacterium]|nr:hypothetical protein [Anaerolineaceae bacterium]